MADKWDMRFLALAKEISTWSKDPSTQLGAIIVDDNRRIVSTGYNGFPHGIDDDARLTLRETKYSLIIHAEMNAIYNATWAGNSPKDCTLYIYGLPPCSDCAKGIIQVGIKRVVAQTPKDIVPTWAESFEKTKEMFLEANVNWEIVC